MDLLTLFPLHCRVNHLLHRIAEINLDARKPGQVEPQQYSVRVLDQTLIRQDPLQFLTQD